MQNDLNLHILHMFKGTFEPFNFQMVLNPVVVLYVSITFRVKFMVKLGRIRLQLAYV